MTRHLLALSAGLLLAGTAAAQPVDDSYRWLEQPRDAKALAWARAKSAETMTTLSARPGHSQLLAELQKLQSAGSPPPTFTLLGPRTARFTRSADKPYGVLDVALRDANGSPGAWRTVIDVGALRAQTGKPYEASLGECLPPAFARCIVYLSPGGGDEGELRELDLETGAMVADGFQLPAGRTFAAWLDKDRLLLQSTVDGDAKTVAGWATATRIWKRGTPFAQSQVVDRLPASSALAFPAAMGSGAERQGVVLRAEDYSTLSYRLVDQSGAVRDVPLPSKIKMLLSAGTQRHLIVQLSEPATVAGKSWPAEAILSYDTNPATAEADRVKPVFVPAGGDFIINPFVGDISSSKSAVHLIVSRRGTSRLLTFEPGPDGWRQTSASPAPTGVTLSVANADRGSDDIVLGRTGFLTPTQLDLKRDGQQLASLHSSQPSFDSSKFMVELRTSRSRDGTEIDTYLLRPKAIKAGTPVPTLMTGYGAFGLSLTPDYLGQAFGGKTLAIWLERGGALAVPMIRGGGEQGAAWHKSAMRENRQRSYDDFAAAAEELISSGFTTPAHLGVFGLSNGGLLSATMGTQRPDLFAAVVSDVPLTDMLRFPEMGMGGAWMNEYGNPSVPADAKVLRSYSPFHNVVDGKRYPAFLITVSTEDNRVGPGHARKLAARLGDAGAKVFYLEDEEGGHGVSDPLSRPAFMAVRMQFLIDTLGVE